MKPIIGITTYSEMKYNRKFSSISYNYCHAVELAGGIPILIPKSSSGQDLHQYMKIIDGILLTGGDDISPMAYGENPIRQVTKASLESDEQDMNLFHYAYKMNVPILGICRGLQLINVSLGGTLYQDIYIQKQDTLGHNPENNPRTELYHTVKVEEHSKLFEIFSERELKVNSFHHQAVKRLAKELKATAFSTDGIIEGIESTQKQFILGVQWHPEDLVVKYPIMLNLFQTFVTECINNKVLK